jgi:hypothetical protein
MKCHAQSRACFAVNSALAAAILIARWDAGALVVRHLRRSGGPLW